MGSEGRINDSKHCVLTIKSSSSSKYNDTKLANRGRAVENQVQACGKSGIISAKPVEKAVKKLSSYTAETRADALISYFNAPHCREFFLKCIYHLPDTEIYEAMQSATRPYVKSPIKYFNKTCKQLLIKHGV